MLSTLKNLIKQRDTAHRNAHQEYLKMRDDMANGKNYTEDKIYNILQASGFTLERLTDEVSVMEEIKGLQAKRDADQKIIDKLPEIQAKRDRIRKEIETFMAAKSAEDKVLVDQERDANSRTNQVNALYSKILELRSHLTA